MSYTNIELVKKHMEFIQPISENIIDQLVICNSNSSIKIFNGSISENSVQVKTINSSEPLKVSLTISADTFSISSAPLVRNSVLCASDSSLGTLYTENIDFVIDYQNATCSLKTGGQLTIGMEITFFYHPYSLYIENSDYKIDYENGSFQRVSSGDIQLGESLYIDYTPLSSNYTDAILSNAVTEANAIIEKEVDPNKEFGADLVLQTVATYRALEILCRSTAMRDLISGSKKDTVNSWIKLADIYLQRATNLVLSFKSPSKQFNKPTHS